MRSWAHVAALGLSVPLLVQAHGLQAQLELEAPAVALRCVYTDSTPADAEVLVYSPTEPNRTFQQQRTDVHGRATFIPDAVGEWRVVVDDGMGHRTQLTVAVDENGVARAVERDSWTGISGSLGFAALVLLVLALLILGMQAQRRRRTAT